MAESATKGLRMLRTHEYTIENLFTMSGPSIVLKVKLTETEVLVAMLGKHFAPQWSCDWNQKITNWWKRYAIALEIANMVSDDSTSLQT